MSCLSFHIIEDSFEFFCINSQCMCLAELFFPIDTDNVIAFKHEVNVVIVKKLFEAKSNMSDKLFNRI